MFGLSFSDVPGQYFKESDTLTAGNQITMFQTDFGATIGVGICYDIRFAEYAMAASKKGADMLIYPGAFNHITGPVHWELLQRGRALDNQLYVATASPSLDPNFSYKAHGHSSIVGPWGNVIAQCQHDDAIVYGDVNLNWVAEVRSRIALRNQKRGDLYEVVAKM
jgi:omega-amidase